MALPVKYGHQQLNSKYIVITSTLEPLDWYPELFKAKPEEYIQLERRFDVIIYVDGPGCYRFLRGDEEDLPEDVSLPGGEEIPGLPPPTLWPSGRTPAAPPAIQPVIQPRQNSENAGRHFFNSAQWNRGTIGQTFNEEQRSEIRNRMDKFRQEMISTLRSTPN